MKVVWVGLVVLGLVGVGAAFVALTPEPGYSDEQLRGFGFTAYPQPRKVADFELVDASGARFDAERLQGRWSLLFFGYANCPDICPLTMSELAKAEELLLESGDTAFQGILVTADPERDTPQVLRRYVAAFSDDFVGVTGSVAALEAFARSLHAAFSKAAGAATEEQDSARGYWVDHSTHLAVVAPNGHHIGFVRAPFDARQIATLVRALGQRRKN